MIGNRGLEYVVVDGNHCKRIDKKTESTAAGINDEIIQIKYNQLK